MLDPTILWLLELFSPYYSWCDMSFNVMIFVKLSNLFFNLTIFFNFPPDLMFFNISWAHGLFFLLPTMAAQSSLVTVSVHDASCSWSLLHWTILSLDDERTSVEAFLFDMALPLCDQGVQHLAKRKHCLQEAKVEDTTASLIRIGNTGWSRSMTAVAITCYVCYC